MEIRKETRKELLMVLRPFCREELAEVLDAADEYAVQHRTPEAIARRLAELHSFLRGLIADPPTC
jgi:hypothetical protein